DATGAQRAITEVNPGFYVARGAVLFRLLAELRPDNAQGELYLTDVVGLAARGGLRVAGVPTERPEELLGIKTRAGLARRETNLRRTLIERWMEAGGTFEGPATVYIGPDVTIGSATGTGPNGPRP